MAKKKEKKEDKEKNKSTISSLSQETVEGISAVVFILISIFLILSPLNKAGVVGDKIFEWFSMLFGIGYYLIPVVLLILGVSFLKSLKDNLATPKLIGGGMFLVSGLGLVSTIFQNGGIVGTMIAKPLISLFDILVTVIFLLGLLTISILIIFNTKLKIPAFLSQKNKGEGLLGDEEVSIKGMPKELPDEEKEDKNETAPSFTPQVPETQEEENRKTSGLIFLSRRSGKHEEFTPPPLSLLQRDSGKPGVGDVKANANIIKRTLKNFGIDIEMDEVSIGPSVTRYAMKPAEGVKLSKIVALQNDLALALAAHPLRIEAPIPGKSLVGIEIPNTTKTMVGLGSLLKDDAFHTTDKPLTVCLGKGITGLPNFDNLAKMPHVLIAGATGSGKSATIHALITSLLYRNHPENLKFIMIDPKRVELTLYNGIPHLLTPVITDAKKSILALKWAAKEMDRRYDILEERKVRDIQSYHKNILEPLRKKAKDGDELPDTMPYIVVIIDELADLMQAFPRELESGIVRLAQMSRAVGIHLMISTQRPSVNVITGLIKANIPARIALQVASQIDSRTILDMPGAEKLLGAGDMLYLSGEMSQPRRIQSAFISEDEVKEVVKWITNHYENDLPEGDIDLNPSQNDPGAIFDSLIGRDENEEVDDDLYEEAKQIVMSAGKASTSYIQRKLRVGYARAARLIDILEERGVVGPADGSKAREVLIGGNTGREENDAEEE